MGEINDLLKAVAGSGSALAPGEPTIVNGNDQLAEKAGGVEQVRDVSVPLPIVSDKDGGDKDARMTRDGSNDRLENELPARIRSHTDASDAISDGTIQPTEDDNRIPLQSINTTNDAAASNPVVTATTGDHPTDSRDLDTSKVMTTSGAVSSIVGGDSTRGGDTKKDTTGTVNDGGTTGSKMAERLSVSLRIAFPSLIAQAQTAPALSPAQVSSMTTDDNGNDPEKAGPFLMIDPSVVDDDGIDGISFHDIIASFEMIDTTSPGVSLNERWANLLTSALESVAVDAVPLSIVLTTRLEASLHEAYLSSTDENVRRNTENSDDSVSQPLGIQQEHDNATTGLTTTEKDVDERKAPTEDGTSDDTKKDEPTSVSDNDSTTDRHKQPATMTMRRRRRTVPSGLVESVATFCAESKQRANRGAVREAVVDEFGSSFPIDTVVDTFPLIPLVAVTDTIMTSKTSGVDNVRADMTEHLQVWDKLVRRMLTTNGSSSTLSSASSSSSSMQADTEAVRAKLVAVTSDATTPESSKKVVDMPSSAVDAAGPLHLAAPVSIKKGKKKKKKKVSVRYRGDWVVVVVTDSFVRSCSFF